MLIQCPECSHDVSDRAAACPRCAFPIAEAMAEAKENEAAERDRLSRRAVGDVDCPTCEARGFVTEGSEDQVSGFYWCAACEHSGRVPLVQSERGFWAVPFSDLKAFVGGGDRQPTFLGTERPAGHRYENAGPRVAESDENKT